MNGPLVIVAGYLSIDAIDAAGERHEGVPGGAALYAALGARAAGARAAIRACVGEDYPASWLAAIAAAGIDGEGIARRPGPTRRARLAHDREGGRRSRTDDAWWERSLALAPPRSGEFGDARVAVACPMPAESLAVLVEECVGLPVVADVSEAFAALSGDALLALVPRMAAFAPSREETRLLLPGLADDEAARTLARLGPHVLQKRGAEGALAVPAGGGEGQALPAPSAGRVRDPTGAGDATVGALAAHLARGATFLDAAALALKAGARAVTGIGPEGLGFRLPPEGVGSSGVPRNPEMAEPPAALRHP